MNICQPPLQCYYDYVAIALLVKHTIGGFGKFSSP